MASFRIPLLSRMMLTPLSAFALSGAGTSPATAAKLMEVRPVDQDILMVFIKDGEVFYQDDGTGATAFLGHAHPEDNLVAYGEGLEAGAAANVANWTLTSADDDRYGPEGLHPVRVHRKSKVNNTDKNWNYKLDHWLYLVLPHPLRQGGSYTLSIAPETRIDAQEADLVYDIFHSVSEAVHVNIIGYMPDPPIKSADLYLWLGDGGPRDYSGFEGNTVHLYNVDTGKSGKAGTVSFWMKRKRELNIGDLTGSDVWNADFTGAHPPGRYRLVIEGVGCSPDFEIRDDIYREPNRTSLRGFFYMRIGEDGEGVSPTPRRPLFIPGSDPEGFVIYLTDLHPYHDVWKSLKGDVWDEPHFKPAAESIFWKHRLPGHPTNPRAVGGHADAMDWDRHLGHVSNIYDLLLPYFLTDGTVGDDDLDIAESGNGIPDLIDEARNEVDFWLSLRHGEAYAHGLTNPSKEKSVMFQAGATSIAAWANAANSAMLADCFRISGHGDLESFYRDEAAKAYAFADSRDDPMLDGVQDVGNGKMRGRDFKFMAAAYLYNLTGDPAYEEVIARETVATGPESPIQKPDEWTQLWGTAAYLLSPRERHFPEVEARMRASIRWDALQACVAGIDNRPSRRSSSSDYWQTPAEVQRVLIADAVSDRADDRALFRKALVLEADWGLGRNPMNMVHMTGLGSRRVEGAYTTGTNDGVPGLHPGHTPYMNLHPWGGTHNGSNPRWFADRGYPDWDKGGWPYQEAYFDCRYSWANSEFTPQQTMRGKMALYAYLYALGKRL